MCGTGSAGRSRFWAAFPARAGSRAAFPVGRPAPVPSWHMVECEECGAVSPRPYPTADDIRSYYADALDPSDWEIDHYVQKDLTAGALDGEAAMAEKITRLNGGPGRLLEVGCAAGWQLKAAEGLGWHTQGIEAAPKFSVFARDEQGLEVFAGTLDEADAAQLGTYQVLLGFDVFEHLHDPAAGLMKLRQMARPGSRLLLTTPDISSRLARFWGLSWRQILPSPSTTRRRARGVLARTGWRLVCISEPRYFDPDPRLERRGRRRELAKFGARALLYVALVKPSARWPALKKVPAAHGWPGDVGSVQLLGGGPAGAGRCDPGRGRGGVADGLSPPTRVRRPAGGPGSRAGGWRHPG